jgi:hypothetical protein
VTSTGGPWPSAPETLGSGVKVAARLPVGPAGEVGAVDVDGKFCGGATSAGLPGVLVGVSEQALTTTASSSALVELQPSWSTEAPTDLADDASVTTGEHTPVVYFRFRPGTRPSAIPCLDEGRHEILRTLGIRAEVVGVETDELDRATAGSGPPEPLALMLRIP